eukprot:TRINITY_DN22495_c0_g1_i1.p1 TRINITY_DN22495_c0_g1~~TRINITY_DN22495_c0_g1_i1.p1  ORF type:complete len:236 (+),score=44.35 TRINITY_DN22495_c0_g1_i1:74-709(+)
MAPQPPSSRDRTEQMRQRLAAKTMNKGGGSKGGPLLGFLPLPRLALCCGRTTSSFLWMVTSAFLAAGLFSAVVNTVDTFAKAIIVASIVHVMYFVNFARTDIAVQVRAVFLLLSVLAYSFDILRLPLYASLLVIALSDAILRYNVLERILYIIPANRPDDDVEVDLDFIFKVFSEAPQPPSKPFSVQHSVREGVGADGFEFGTSRAERRKK